MDTDEMAWNAWNPLHISMEEIHASMERILYIHEARDPI